MKSKILFAVVTAILMSNANASMELARSKNCLACHAMDKKLVGPAFVDVKNKYSNNSVSVTELANKIRKGGSGNWGVIPMPSNLQLTEQESVVLSKWILGK